MKLRHLLLAGAACAGPLLSAAGALAQTTPKPFQLAQAPDGEPRGRGERGEGGPPGGRREGPPPQAAPQQREAPPRAEPREAPPRPEPREAPRAAPPAERAAPPPRPEAPPAPREQRREAPPAAREAPPAPPAAREAPGRDAGPREREAPRPDRDGPGREGPGSRAAPPPPPPAARPDAPPAGRPDARPEGGPAGRPAAPAVPPSATQPSPQRLDAPPAGRPDARPDARPEGRPGGPNADRPDRGAPPAPPVPRSSAPDAPPPAPGARSNAPDAPPAPGARPDQRVSPTAPGAPGAPPAQGLAPPAPSLAPPAPGLAPQGPAGARGDRGGFGPDGRRTEERDGRTYIRENDNRLIIRQGDREIIRHDEVERLRRGARDVDVFDRPGGSREIVIVRPDGDRIVTFVDSDGNLLRRVRRGRDGRDFVIIDNERGRPRGGGAYFAPPVELPPLRLNIPRERYIVEAEDAPYDVIEETLMAPPVERVERPYSLDEVRYNQRLREKVRRVDVDTINFATGSATVEQNEAGRLDTIARALSDVIRRNPNEVFLIEGHTDAVGGDTDNLALSDRRAESVAAILTDRYQIPAENLVTQGYGEQYLKVQTQGAERQNRRVTLRRITPLLQQGQQQDTPR